jgi:hypothetical protein
MHASLDEIFVCWRTLSNIPGVSEIMSDATSILVNSSNSLSTGVS